MAGIEYTCLLGGNSDKVKKDLEVLSKIVQSPTDFKGAYFHSRLRHLHVCMILGHHN
jgi:hypothetical protein